MEGETGMDELNLGLDDDQIDDEPEGDGGDEEAGKDLPVEIDL